VTARLLAVVAVVLAAGAGLAPAAVAQDPEVWTVAIDEPEAEFTTAPVITGTVTHPPLATDGTVSVTLRPGFVLPDRCPAPEPPPDIKIEPEPTSEEDRFSTEPVKAGCNGPYAVTARYTPAEGGPAVADAIDGATIKLAVPAAPPTAPELTKVEDGLDLEWDAIDPKDMPNMVGFRLERSTPGRADPKVFTFGPTVTSFSDEVGPGSYSYRLRVLRWGGDGPGSPAVASPVSEESPTATVPPSEESPTATVPPPDMVPRGTVPPGPTLPPPTGRGGNVSTLTVPDLSIPKAPIPKAPSPSPSPRLSPGPALTIPARPLPRSGSSVGSDTTTTIDDGFQSTLPFDDPVTGDEAAVAADPLPTTRGRVVQRYEDSPRPGLVVPMALGLLLIAMAAHIRYLLHQAAQPAPAIEGLDVDAADDWAEPAGDVEPAGTAPPTYDRWLDDLDAAGDPTYDGWLSALDALDALDPAGAARN